MNLLTEIFLKIVIETILVSGVIGYIITRREERLKKKIEEEFKKRDTFFNAQFNFKLRSLEELLAPIKLQLMRSAVTLRNYKANDVYREKILKECNETIRSLLLGKGFLIPANLLPYAEKLISHFDEWLQAYQQAREVQNNTKTEHVFTYNFPHDAEQRFTEQYEMFLKELEIEGSLK